MNIDLRYLKEPTIKIIECKANWDGYGKSAGIRRNIEMLEKHSPDYVIAFKGGRGTQHMTQIALKAQLPVFYVNSTSQGFEIIDKKTGIKVE